MKTPVHRDTRTDDLDVRAFEEMVESKPFQLYLQSLTSEYQRWALQCTREENDTLLRRAQGATEAMRVAIAIPKNMLDAMKKKVSRNAE